MTSPYDSGLQALRSLAESMMQDTCIITRPDPAAERGHMDPDTMKYPEPARVTVYGPDIAPHFGKCNLRVASDRSNSQESGSGDRTSTTQDSELQLPVSGTSGVAVKDTAQMLTVAHDDALVGRVYTITALHQESHAKSRRLPVTEETG